MLLVHVVPRLDCIKHTALKQGIGGITFNGNPTGISIYGHQSEYLTTDLGHHGIRAKGVRFRPPKF